MNRCVDELVHSAFRKFSESPAARLTSLESYGGGATGQEVQAIATSKLKFAVALAIGIVPAKVIAYSHFLFSYLNA